MISMSKAYSIRQLRMEGDSIAEILNLNLNLNPLSACPSR